MFCKICGRYNEKGNERCVCGASLGVKKVNASQYDKFVYIKPVYKTYANKVQKKYRMNNKQKCCLCAYFAGILVLLFGYFVIPICVYGIIKGNIYKNETGKKTFGVWVNVFIFAFSFPYTEFLNDKLAELFEYRESEEYESTDATIFDTKGYDLYPNSNIIYLQDDKYIIL